MPNLIWWGRSDTEYSRNRIMRELLLAQGWQIHDFFPRFSLMADIEARWTGLTRADLIWVPCFRQRDMAAALRFARRQKLPLLFDPLISVYDKRVFEQTKVTPRSPKAERLRAWESDLFNRADLVLADTPEHARFFVDDMGLSADKAVVVHVGADEELFHPCPPVDAPPSHQPLRVLFYGSFLHLHGPMTIIEAARRCQELPVDWLLLGDGALKPECIKAAEGLDRVTFLDWAPYAELPGVICICDVVLGIFGDTPKASRVIPNKVFQSLACGRPVVTRHSPAYGSKIGETANSGLLWVPPADPCALARVVADLVERRDVLPSLGQAARSTYLAHYARDRIQRELKSALERLGFRDHEP